MLFFFLTLDSATKPKPNKLKATIKHKVQRIMLYTGCKPHDIGYVLDVSSSIHSKNKKDLRKFVIEISKRIPIGLDENRVSFKKF